jgi:hypothetical protein
MSQAAIKLNSFIQSITDSNAFRQIQTEFATKPIMKFGAWLIFGIVILYTGLVISDETASIRNDYENVKNQLSRVKQIQSEHFWSDRLDVERKNAEGIKKAIRQASSTSLAKAQIQTVFSDLARNHEILQPRINATEPLLYGKYDSRDVYTVSVELRGRLKKGRILNIINELARAENLQEIQRLDIDFEQNRRIHLIISTYFFIDG